MDPIQERKIEEIIQQGLNPYASSSSLSHEMIETRP